MQSRKQFETAKAAVAFKHHLKNARLPPAVDINPNEPKIHGEDGWIAAPIPKGRSVRKYTFIHHGGVFVPAPRGNNQPVLPPNLPKYPPKTAYPAQTMSVEDRCLLAGAAPGVPFSAPSGHPHDHPVSHTLRVYNAYHALDVAITEFPRARRAVDIGGSPRIWKHHPANYGLHHMQPLVSAADVIRTASSVPQLNTCTCIAPGSCALCALPDFFLSIHSLYYLTPDDVLDIAQRAPIYAVVHAFDGLRGKIHELEWTRVGKEVETTVSSNLRTYRHSNLDWLYCANYHTDGTVAMAWDIKMSQTGHHLARIRSAPLGLKSDAHHVFASTHAMQLAVDGLGSYEKVIPIGPYWVRGLSSNNYYDVRVFEVMVAWFSGRAITPTTVSDGMAKAEKVASSMGKVVNESTNLQQLVAQAASTAALRMKGAVGVISANISDVRIHNATMSSAIFEVGRLQVVLNWFNSNRWALYMMLGASVLLALSRPRKTLSMILAVLPWPFGQRTGRGRLTAQGSLGLLDTPLFYIGYLARFLWNRLTRRARARDWRTSIEQQPLLYKTRHVPLLRKYNPNGFTHIPAYCANRLTSEKKQSAGSTITLPREVICTQRIGSSLTAIGFKNWIPLVAQACVHNEFVAIAERVTLETPPPTAKPLTISPTSLPPPSAPADAVLEWLAGLEPKKREAYIKWATGMPATDSELARHELFVKRENAVKGRADEINEQTLTPRAIQTSTPYSNFTLGPFVSSFSKEFEKHQMDTHPNFICAYTLTPQQLSDQLYKRLGHKSYTYASIDVIRADASVRPEFTKTKRQAFECSGMDKETSKFVGKNRRVAGRSRFGVVYSCNKGLASGEQSTTITHCLFIFSVWDKYFRDTRGALLVNKSDDNELIVDHDKLWVIDEFRARLREQGYDTTCMVTDHMPSAEFLSMRFYKGVRGFFAAPKIGRTMSKLFWTCYPQTIGDPLAHAATVCNGLRHLREVPIFGAMLERVAELTAGCENNLELVSAHNRHKTDWSGTRVEREPMLDAFCIMYDTSRDEIARAEAQLRAVDVLPAVVDNKLIDRIVSRDLGFTPMPGVACSSLLNALRSMRTPPVNLPLLANVLLEEFAAKFLGNGNITVFLILAETLAATYIGFPWKVVLVYKIMTHGLLYLARKIGGTKAGVVVHYLMNFMISYSALRRCVTVEDVRQHDLDVMTLTVRTLTAPLRGSWTRVKSSIANLAKYLLTSGAVEGVPAKFSGPPRSVAQGSLFGIVMETHANMNFSEREVARGRQILKKLVKNNIASADSVEAYMRMLNPCPDGQARTIGLPSMGSGPTAKLKYTSTFEVKAPPSGSAWDAHILLCPVGGYEESVAANPTMVTVAGNGNATGTPSAGQMAPLVVLTAPSGVPLPLVPGTATYHLDVRADKYDLFADSVKGTPFRVVAQGLEVINTSPAIYKSGVMHGYATDSGSTSAYQSTLTPTGKLFKLYSLSGGNQLPSQVLNLPNTFTVEGADGVYIPCLPNDVASHPFETPGASVFTKFLSHANNETKLHTEESVHPYTHMNWAGVFAKGLHKDTTLMIRVTTYLELLPMGSRDLLSISTPRVAFSPELADLMCRLITELPAGISFVDGNPSGEWFDKVLGLLADVAPLVAPIAAGLHPAAGMGVAAVGQIAGALRTGGGNQQVLPQKKKKKTDQTRGRSAARPSQNEAARRRTRSLSVNRK